MGRCALQKTYRKKDPRFLWAMSGGDAYDCCRLLLPSMDGGAKRVTDRT